MDKRVDVGLLVRAVEIKRAVPATYRRMEATDRIVRSVARQLARERQGITGWENGAVSYYTAIWGIK